MATLAIRKNPPVVLQLSDLKAYAEWHAAGKALREACPRQSHAAWEAPANRRNSVELVLASEKGRIPKGDPLFLQVKEARTSVLEPYAGRSIFPNHGQRVVNGYRLMQPASDMFLGWTEGPKRHYFIRQLRDIKISIAVETFGCAEMDLYAKWCGRALALSHARSGSSAILSGYMGKSDAFDRAIAAFSLAYADQNEKDHAALDRAVRKGKVKAVFEETT